MSDTTDLMGAADTNVDTSAPAAGAATKRRRSGTGLDGMVLAELQQVASGLGIRGTARMRKGQLIEVIKETQAGSSAPKAAASAPAASADSAETKPKRRVTSKARTGEAAAEAPAEKTATQAQIDIPGQPASEDAPVGERRRRRATAPSGSPEGSAPAAVQVEAKAEAAAPAAQAETKTEAATAASGQAQGQDGEGRGRRDRRERGSERTDGRRERRDRGAKADDQGQGAQGQGQGQAGQGGQGQGQNQGQGQGQQGGRQDRTDRQDRQQGGRGQGQNQGQNQGQGQQGGRQDRDRQDNGPQDDFDEDGRRGRRGRYRDRRGRRGRDEFAPAEPQVADDDVLIPVAGILDILDNYAFIRTSGYLPGPNDVYVSLAQVRKAGLRKGDHTTGAVRQPKDGERREKFNALVRLDSVNGMAPESGRGRPEFQKLTPCTPRTGSVWRPTRAC